MDFETACENDLGSITSFLLTSSSLSDYVTSSVFTPCLGIHSPSQLLSVIGGRTMVALHDNSWQQYMYIPTRDLTEEAEKHDRSMAREYVKEKCRVAYENKKLRIEHHGFFNNGNKHVKEKLDQFFNFVRLYTNNHWMKQLTLTLKIFIGFLFNN